MPARELLAGEAALLHNFVWRERWTWRDRPPGTSRTRLERLATFHLANGLVSLATNIVVTALGTRLFRCDVLVANTIAIATAPVANVAAGDRLVFRPARPLLIRGASAREASAARTVHADALATVVGGAVRGPHRS